MDENLKSDKKHSYNDNLYSFTKQNITKIICNELRNENNLEITLSNIPNYMKNGVIYYVMDILELKNFIIDNCKTTKYTLNNSEDKIIKTYNNYLMNDNDKNIYFKNVDGENDKVEEDNTEIIKNLNKCIEEKEKITLDILELIKNNDICEKEKKTLTDELNKLTDINKKQRNYVESLTNDNHDLNEKNNNLKKELIKLNTQFNHLDKKNRDKINSQESNISTLENELKSKDSYILTLQNTLKTRTGQYKELYEKNIKLDETITHCTEIARQILDALPTQGGGVNPHLTDFLKHFLK